jgi:hypothetical protein
MGIVIINRLFFAASMAVWLLKIHKKRYLSMYPSSTRYTLDICLFGLVKSLEFQHKNLNLNMVLNRLDAKGLQLRQTPISTSNFGVGMVIGLPSKAKNAT